MKVTITNPSHSLPCVTTPFHLKVGDKFRLKNGSNTYVLVAEPITKNSDGISDSGLILPCLLVGGDCKQQFTSLVLISPVPDVTLLHKYSEIEVTLK